jgi:23S rRNA-/tRNA-specific pseudouridylate synthase
VLLVALDAETASVLSTAFERGRVKKEYLAIVAGGMKEEEGEIDLPIGDAPGSHVFVRRGVVDGGERALTRWRVERRLEGATLLRLFPKTGRRHQLRVHLEAIGHPILGDALYGRDDRDYLDLVAGTRDARIERGGPRRQLLHAARLRVEDEGIDIEAATPADFSL